MNPEPHQATLAEGLFDAECEQPSGEIVSDRIQVWRNRVGSASEVEVVRDVEYVVDKLRE